MAQQVVKIGVKLDRRWWKAVIGDSCRGWDNTMWVLCITATWWQKSRMVMGTTRRW